MQYRRLRNSCSQECFIHASHRYRMTDQILARTTLCDPSGSLLPREAAQESQHGRAEDRRSPVPSGCCRCLPHEHPPFLLFPSNAHSHFSCCMALSYFENWFQKPRITKWLRAMKFVYTHQENEEHL